MSELSIETTRNIWTLHGYIEVQSGVQRSTEAPRSRQTKIPTIEEAQRAAGVKSQEPKRKPGQKRRPGLTFRQQQH